MAKKKTSDILSEIKKLIEGKKAVLGTKNTLKGLKLGKLSKVYITSNCPANVRKDIEHYSRLAKIPVVEMSYPNDELGVLCKKPYSISVLSQVK